MPSSCVQRYRLQLLLTAFALLLTAWPASIYADELPDGALVFLQDKKPASERWAYPGISLSRLTKREYHSPPFALFTRKDKRAWGALGMTFERKLIHDLRPYRENGALELWIKGNIHPRYLGISLYAARKKGASVASSLHLSDYVNIAPRWQKIVIPLKDFPDQGSYWTAADGTVKAAMDWSEIRALAIGGSATDITLEYYLDDVIIVPQQRVSEDHLQSVFDAARQKLADAEENLRCHPPDSPAHVEKIKDARRVADEAWTAADIARKGSDRPETLRLAKKAASAIGYLYNLTYPSRALKLQRPLRRQLSAWLLDYGTESLRSFVRNAKYIDTICVMKYQIDKDTEGLMTNSTFEFDTAHLLRIAHAHGTRVLVTTQNNGGQDNNPEIIIAMISDKQKARRHAILLAEEVVSNGFDGLDVDYEGLLDQDGSKKIRPNFSAFIRLLSQELHARGKILSVTVHAKVNSPGHWFPRTQDWSAIGAAADEVRIMCYDYWWGEEGGQGPHQPQEWLEKIIQLAKQIIPAEKAIIALSTYSLDWGADGSHTYLGYAQAESLRLRHHKLWNYKTKLPRARYQLGAAPRFTYSKDGKKHVVWGTNKKSLMRQAMTADTEGIAGICLWALGDEPPGFWQALSKQLKKQ